MSFFLVFFILLEGCGGGGGFMFVLVNFVVVIWIGFGEIGGGIFLFVVGFNWIGVLEVIVISKYKIN